MMKRLLLLVLVPILVLAWLCRAQTQSAKSLTDVRRIYVGSMGQSDEAERFRILLRSQLAKEGFTVVGDEKDADASLSGVLTVRVYADESRARATVSLASGDRELWSGDFEPHISTPLVGTSDTVKARAEDVAKKLKKECKLTKK